MPLKIEVFIAETCGSYYQLRENLDQALAELRIAADVAYRTIYYDDAVSRDILGSPSIWINGKDAFEGGNSPGVT
ncbi:MAG TPA: thioredoxin family protein [Nitrospirota bacterium]